MVTVWEKDTEFVFPDGWEVRKYDQAPSKSEPLGWSYYRKHLHSIAMACDFVATDGSIAYLIEVKDYGVEKATAPIDLPEKVATKTLDTLGGLVAARQAAGGESEFAAKVLACDRIRLVLQIGIPDRTGPLADPGTYLANLQVKLKGAARHILPHPAVHPFGGSALPWTTIVHRKPK